MFCFNGAQAIRGRPVRRRRNVRERYTICRRRFSCCNTIRPPAAAGAPPCLVRRCWRILCSCASTGAVFNGHSSSHSACTVQTTYVGRIGYKIGPNQPVVLTRKSSTGISYSQCADATVLSADTTITGYLGVNGTTITFPSLMGCSNVVLSQ